MIVATVKIKADNEDGYMVINESDFDKKVHTLFGETKAKAKPAKAKAKADDAKKELDPESTTPDRCLAVKGDGDQCGNDSLDGSDYCQIKAHQKQGK